jgi:hypothetical protein
MPVTIIKADPRAREKPCLRCGYSLRRLTDGTHCPECGLSVWLSLNQNDTLEMSNPEWLRRMAVALWVMAAASLVSLAAYVPTSMQMFRTMQYRQQVHQAMRAAERASDDPNAWAAAIQIRRMPPPRPDPLVMHVLWTVGTLGFVAYNGGLLVLTSDERRYPDRLKSLRVGAKVIAGLAGLAVVMAFLQMLHPTPLGFPEWTTRLAAVGAAMLAWNYLRVMARRMPHKTLTRVAGWMTVIPLVSLFYSFIRDSDWPPDLIPLLYLPASAVLFLWFARALRQAATVADRNWTTETAMTR